MLLDKLQGISRVNVTVNNVEAHASVYLWMCVFGCFVNDYCDSLLWPCPILQNSFSILLHTPGLSPSLRSLTFSPSRLKYILFHKNKIITRGIITTRASSVIFVRFFCVLILKLHIQHISLHVVCVGQMQFPLRYMGYMLSSVWKQCSGVRMWVLSLTYAVDCSKCCSVHFMS